MTGVMQSAGSLASVRVRPTVTAVAEDDNPALTFDPRSFGESEGEPRSDAVVHAALVAPTPLLIVHGTTDTKLLPEYAQEAYAAALGPKELVRIETHNHIELYDQDPFVSEAAAHAIRWLDRHLASE